MAPPDIGLNFLARNEKTQELDLEEVLNKNLSTNEKFYHSFVIPNLIFFIVLHACALVGAYQLLFHAKILTMIWWFLLGFGTGECITLGAHRYYSHKSYKATKALQVAYIILETMAGQNSMYTWARDHRVHHKYSDTDADPHNATRGFWFSHIGWLVMKKHPLVKEKSKCVDVSDLLEDKLVMFQHNYFVPFYLVVGFIIPTYLPVLAWGENWWTSFFVTYCLRYTIILHVTWFINSLAHLIGTRPYDKRLVATDSAFVGNLTGGDACHNYHHTFPWDAKIGEFRINGGFNTKLLFKLVDWGQAYDLKHASDGMIANHAKKHGDGSHPEIQPDPEEEADGPKKNGLSNETSEKALKTN